MIPEILSQSLQRQKELSTSYNSRLLKSKELATQYEKLKNETTEVRAELEAIQKRIEKGYKAIRESSNGEQRIEEVKKEISRLGGLIAWQDNRSKQFKTIIERGY